MHGRDQGVCERVQVLVGDRRQLDEPHPLLGVARKVDVVRAAVNGHFVPAFYESLAELLNTCLKAAVAGRDSSGAKKSDSHARTFSYTAAVSCAVLRQENCAAR
jgi:hypothetical protein